MKTKHLFVLGVIFFALIALSLFHKIYTAQTVAKQVPNEEWHPLIPQDKAAQILLSRQGFSSVELKKYQSVWKVESLLGVHGDTPKINELINQLNQVKAELRAEGEDLYGRFGITDQESFRLQIFDSKGMAIIDFLMGARRAGAGVFIRLPGKAKIYSVADDLPNFLGLFSNIEQAGPRSLYFADLKLIPEKIEQIQNFEVTQLVNEKKSVLAALERPSQEAGSLWKFSSESWRFSVSPQKIEDYLNFLTGAQAESIIETQTSFKNEFEITLKGGIENVITLQFSKTEKGWLMKRENSAALYEVSPHVFDELKVNNARFIVDNSLGIDMNEENIVELVSDGKIETFSKASGWPSAAVILDAASKIEFLSVELDKLAKDLSNQKPSHQLRVIREGKTTVEIKFYVTDPQTAEIKTGILGQDFVFKVSRSFFESIFVPTTPPAENLPPKAP